MTPGLAAQLTTAASRILVLFTDNSSAILLADISGSPKLFIVAAGGNAQLSWTTNFGIFNLQATTQLPAVTWTNVGIAPAVINGLNQVLVPVAPDAQFFRLAISMTAG